MEVKAQPHLAKQLEEVGTVMKAWVLMNDPKAWEKRKDEFDG